MVNTKQKYFVKYTLRGKVEFDLDADKENMSLIQRRILDGEVGTITEIEIDEINHPIIKGRKK